MDSQSSSSSARLPRDYTSLNSLSALSKRVTVRFIRTVQHLGFIDAASDSEDIAAGTQLELPLWLANKLLEEQLVTIDLPKGFNEQYRDILEADASVVDLHKLGPDFYKFGGELSKSNIPESEEIAKTMVETFHQRIHKIMDYSLNASGDTPFEMAAFQNTLDNVELELFEEGKKCSKELKKWENRTLGKICANDKVVGLKKRKLAELELKEPSNNSHN
ncbi:hypothetical protein B4U80_10775 [Leptotrombidium deliense]|uniref:DNA replication complex GINS protein PSF3 n=1 Tax=Leptotrombidium deliense TaxID=299467 RepID=A0A443SI07_9ACAR|nr:hypothetical protein B4U80_10775 [Leptotrombidium deliense]